MVLFVVHKLYVYVSITRIPTNIDDKHIVPQSQSICSSTSGRSTAIRRRELEVQQLPLTSLSSSPVSAVNATTYILA